jgi:23S rRNA pseudouridine1911/1915/1917 synthase
MVINKPSGQLFHGRTDGLPQSLVEQLRGELRKEKPDSTNPYIGVVHRLDRPVSGICIFGRNSKFTGRLSQQFGDRSAQKIYLALVNGRFETTDITEWQDELEELPTDRNPGGTIQQCRLKLRLVTKSNQHSLVQINLLTGRRHQIRRQFSKRGFPIVGDLEYGASQLEYFEQNIADRRFRPIMLHSFHLSLTHPSSNERVSFMAEPPIFWMQIFAEFGISPVKLSAHLDW